MNPKIRVADYIVDVLAKHGVRHVFMVTGGGAMHLNDAFGRNKELQYVACHHEQACAMAAESYFRMTNRLAAVNVTTGPGGTNAITGVWGAWVDSMAMIVLSGQVKYETVVRSTGLPLRQLGDQEIDIVRLVSSITKYSEMVTDPQTVGYHLEKALFLATQGRPGPVWLDIPMNVQGALIDLLTLPRFDSEAEFPEKSSTTDLTEACNTILERLNRSKRPVIFAGTGIRLAGAHDSFLQLVDRWKIPVVTAWNSHDLIWNSHPNYVGRPGSIGDRAGNFAVQNSDFLLVLGCRLNIRLVSYNWKAWAREAYKVIVDIDENELKKPTVRPDLAVHADVGQILNKLLSMPAPQSSQALSGPSSEHGGWLKWCRARTEKYPVVLSEYWKIRDRVNPYCFVESLFNQLDENDRVVTGDGTACVVTFQAANIKKGQRLYTNSGCASMGYDLPAAIGACIATQAKRLICIAGDGSLQMNLQELQTAVTHRLPLKIFILNNQGYHSIRQTQQNYFPDNIVGCGTESGLGFPNFEKLAGAYGIPYTVIPNHSELESGVKKTLSSPGIQICEVILDLNQQFAPKLSSRKLADGRMISAPLEDLAPFLPRDEFRENLLIAPLDEST